MKIQFVTTAFNGMAQRLWIEIDRLNHEVKVHIVTTQEKMIEAVDNYKPDLIIAPFLTSKIPAQIYENYICLIVHPGIKGDRGASSLDWAILQNKKTWGVTILQAAEKMDAGSIWATNEFKMRNVSKAEIYRNEVTQAAAKGILQVLNIWKDENFEPEKLDYSKPEIKGRWNSKTTQNDYFFSWKENAQSIIRKINAADSSPGVKITIFNVDYYCFGAHLEKKIKGKPGEVIAQRNKAICIATNEDAVWLTHLKDARKDSIKLPAISALNEIDNRIPVVECSPFDKISYQTWREIRFVQEGDIGYLHFDFYNGAMSTSQCNRLREAIVDAKTKCKLLVLIGGKDVWSNGIHLNVIENAENPADESWENILAIDDLILEIITSTNHYIISALQGNAGAGGVALALAGDKVLCRNGIVLNPHTKNMGLYGSEYWTYLLPKRIGIEKAMKFTEECLPWGVAVAKDIGLIDDYEGETNQEFVQFVKKQAERIIQLSFFDKLLRAKQLQRRKDEMNKPLSTYRQEELVEMKANFYENNWGYNERRRQFVYKWNEDTNEDFIDLFESRRSIYRKRKWESIKYKGNKDE